MPLYYLLRSVDVLSSKMLARLQSMTIGCQTSLGVSPLSGELVARHQQLFYSFQRLVAAPPRAESLNATVLLCPTSHTF